MVATQQQTQANAEIRERHFRSYHKWTKAWEQSNRDFCKDLEEQHLLMIYKKICRKLVEQIQLRILKEEYQLMSTELKSELEEQHRRFMLKVNHKMEEFEKQLHQLMQKDKHVWRKLVEQHVRKMLIDSKRESKEQHQRLIEMESRILREFEKQSQRLMQMKFHVFSEIKKPLHQSMHKTVMRDLLEQDIQQIQKALWKELVEQHHQIMRKDLWGKWEERHHRLRWKESLRESAEQHHLLLWEMRYHRRIRMTSGTFSSLIYSLLRFENSKNYVFLRTQGKPHHRLQQMDLWKEMEEQHERLMQIDIWRVLEKPHHKLMQENLSRNLVRSHHELMRKEFWIDVFEEPMMLKKQFAQTTPSEFRFQHSQSFKWMKILTAIVLLMSFMMQVDCQICEGTLQIVSRCPSNAEEYQNASQKCSNACRASQKDIPNMYQYHCVCNTNKTEIIEICAVVKYLFDYCPMYDPISKVIQMDETTKCNANSTRRYYNSSDLFHCDKSCFKLDQKSYENYTTSTQVNEFTRTPVENATKTQFDGEKKQVKVLITVIYIYIVVSCFIGFLFIEKRNNWKEQRMDLSNTKSNHQDEEMSFSLINPKYASEK